MDIWMITCIKIPKVTCSLRASRRLAMGRTEVLEPMDGTETVDYEAMYVLRGVAQRSHGTARHGPQFGLLSGNGNPEKETKPEALTRRAICMSLSRARDSMKQQTLAMLISPAVRRLESPRHHPAFHLAACRNPDSRRSMMKIKIQARPRSPRWTDGRH